MTKLLVVDLCNTLADINGELIKRGLDPSGHKLSAELDIWQDESLYLSAKPWEPSRQVMAELLEEGYELVYMTARPAEMINTSMAWLDSNKFPSSRCVCSSGSNKGQELLKLLDEYKDVSDVVFMEDSPKEIESLLKVMGENNLNLQIIIPRHEYNMHIESSREINLS